jgi:hypothetical protein
METLYDSDVLKPGGLWVFGAALSWLHVEFDAIYKGVLFVGAVLYVIYLAYCIRQKHAETRKANPVPPVVDDDEPEVYPQP